MNDIDQVSIAPIKINHPNLSNIPVEIKDDNIVSTPENVETETSEPKKEETHIPFYKTTWFLVLNVIILIVLICILLYICYDTYFTNKKTDTKEIPHIENIHHFKPTYKIHKPPSDVSSIDIPFNEIKITEPEFNKEEEIEDNEEQVQETSQTKQVRFNPEKTNIIQLDGSIIESDYIVGKNNIQNDYEQNKPVITIYESNNMMFKNNKLDSIIEVSSDSVQSNSQIEELEETKEPDEKEESNNTDELTEEIKNINMDEIDEITEDDISNILDNL